MVFTEQKLVDMAGVTLVVVGGLLVTHHKPAADLPNSAEIRANATENCQKQLQDGPYRNMPVPQDVYERCVNQTVTTLSSPANRFTDQYLDELLGVSLILGGILLVLLPRVLKGKLRFGLG